MKAFECQMCGTCCYGKGGIFVKEDEIAQLMKSGAEDFIRKPFNITELTDKITVVLQMK